MTTLATALRRMRKSEKHAADSHVIVFNTNTTTNINAEADFGFLVHFSSCKLP
jgi:hypothetical protein